MDLKGNNLKHNEPFFLSRAVVHKCCQKLKIPQLPLSLTKPFVKLQLCEYGQLDSSCSGRVQYWALGGHSNELLGSIKGREFIDKMSDCFLQEDLCSMELFS
jgi:hypothetical protein